MGRFRSPRLRLRAARASPPAGPRPTGRSTPPPTSSRTGWRRPKQLGASARPGSGGTHEPVRSAGRACRARARRAHRPGRSRLPRTAGCWRGRCPSRRACRCTRAAGPASTGIAAPRGWPPAARAVAAFGGRDTRCPAATRRFRSPCHRTERAPGPKRAARRIESPARAAAGTHLPGLRGSRGHSLPTRLRRAGACSGAAPGIHSGCA